MEQLSFETAPAEEESPITASSAARLLRQAIAPYLAELGEVAKKIRVEENSGYVALKAGSALAAKIEVKAKGILLSVKTKHSDSLPEFNWNPVANKMSRTPYISLSALLDRSFELCEIAVKSLPPGERYGCCSRVMECSDAMKCTQPMQLLSLACIYRENLKQGKVFYGKNRNIP